MPHPAENGAALRWLSRGLGLLSWVGAPLALPLLAAVVPMGLFLGTGA